MSAPPPPSGHPMTKSCRFAFNCSNSTHVHASVMAAQSAELENVGGPNNGDDVRIEWSNGCRYLGIFVTSGATFKCKFDAAKAKFYRSFNAIMCRAGSCASLEVLFTLMRSKCVPALLYGIEACPVNTKETRSLEYPITCAFFKIPNSSSSDLVNEYRLAFGFRQFSHVIADKKKCFNLKYISSNNTVCKAVSAWTLN